jgi:hypothetical protein
VKKEGGRDVWRIEATIDRLAAGLKELREAIAEIVRRAGVDEKKAERWLEKLETGRTVWEDRPKYYMGLARSGALDIRYRSTSRKNIEREARWLENMGLEEGKHFTVKMPEGGKAGYVSLLKEGLAHAAWLSVYGTEGQRDLAAEFVKYILKRAEEEGKEVSEKAQKIIEEGKTRASLKLEDFEKKVEVNGRMHVVKVISGGAEFDKGRSGKKLLRIRITAEVDGVRSDYTITFGRYRRDNAAMGYATAKADDAERFSALIKALTGKEPWVYQRSDGKIEIVCGREHLEGFKRYAELADAIEKWLEETGRRA